MTQARAIARIVARVLEWQRATTNIRCAGCGARVGRSPAELALDAAAEEYRAMLATSQEPQKHAATFDSEAPTEPHKRK